MMALWTLCALPTPDPLPLAGPVGLFRTLLIITFLLHLIPMNLLVGGAMLGLVARLRGTTDAHASRFARMVGHMLPLIFAVAVNAGVAALLFLQVLYGRAFFGAAVIMAWPWLSVIVLLLLSYALIYRLAFTPLEARPALGGYMVAAASLLTIAFIYVNAMSLMLRPADFEAMTATGTSGWRLATDDVSLLPRFLHLIIGALAVAGATTAGLGWWRARGGHNEAFDRWLMRYGSGWASLATFVNLFAGTWWLLSLPAATRASLLGRDALATTSLMLGVTAALVAMLAFALASRAHEPGPPVGVGMASLPVTLVAMVLTRDHIRSVALQRAGWSEPAWIAPQWSAIGAFCVAVVLAAGAGVWLYRLWHRRATTTSRASR